MARIPLGNFGNAIAAPAPRVRAPAGAFDSGGAGMQQAGDNLVRFGAMEMDEQRKADERQRQEDLALTRAKAANAVLDREITVKSVGQSLEQEISSGAVNYNDAPAEYRRRVGELGAPSMTGLDPVTAENLQRGIKRADFVGENSINSAIKTARVADFKTQAEGILDKLGKQAGMPGADVVKLNSQAEALEEIGTQAYGPAWAKRKQDWKDNNWNDQLNQQAMSVRDDLKGITTLQQQISGGDFADKLDSSKRNTLIAKLDGYRTSLIQRNEAAAARATRLEEHRLKQAEAEFNVFTTVADKGTIIAPEYIDQAIKKTAGTPYQQGVADLARQAAETGGIASQPIRSQQAMLDQLDTQIAKHGRTPALDKRREQVQKVLDGSQSDLKQNGLRAGLERGVITELAPLDISTPEAFSASVGKRLQQSEVVGLWAGKAVSPLDAREAEQVRTMLDSLQPKQKSQAVATLAESVGPRAASAIAEQLDGKDKALSLAFAASGAKTTGSTNWLGNSNNDARYVSELIIKGSGAIKDGTVMNDEKKVTGWKATISNQIDGAFNNENTAGKIKEAAYFIAAGIAAENGGSVSTNDLERSVRLAVGGGIIERNGKKIPIPAGMDADSLDKRLRSVSTDEIMRQTGPAGGGIAPGMLNAGNIDLAKRPTVKNADGSISTVRSMSANIDGAEVLLPTVSDDGKILTEKQAIDVYMKTGKHLGKFKTPEDATAYAESLHNNQASAYTVRAGGVQIPVADFVKSLPGQELLYAGPGQYAVIVRWRPVVNSAGKPIIIGVQ